MNSYKRLSWNSMFKRLNVALLMLMLLLPGCAVSPMQSTSDTGSPTVGDGCLEDEEQHKKKPCDKLPNGSGSDVPTVDSAR